MRSYRRMKILQIKPAGVFSPKLSRILPQKGAVSPSPAWLKKFESTVTQNPMTVRRFFIIVIEKYLGKESNSKRGVPIFPLLPAQGQTEYPSSNDDHEMTDSSHVWTPDLGDHLGDFGDEIWDLKGAGIFSISLLGKEIRLNVLDDSM
ncbi:hypothetical protein AVEN_153035-1 [Araneus ventricosus]|uniref:Uncharacterized protein n=1 Tax=Araneus ventricosus TaxID=182803 RepID=A0A4Y2JBL6_ARAVE|nr:hypothetical protein AVEN_153035-1 [Araneus ventricosus]